MKSVKWFWSYGVTKGNSDSFLYIYIYIYIYILWGRKVIGISRSLIWSKTLMELIFNPYGEFRWSPEGPVSQIHSPHHHVDVLAIFSDLLRYIQMLKREWGVESNGKLLQIFNPWQNCCLGSCACSEGPALGQNTLMMMIYYELI